MRDWVTKRAHNALSARPPSSARILPHMSAILVIIGREAREQISLPKRVATHLFACVGGGPTPSASSTLSCRRRVKWSASKPAARKALGEHAAAPRRSESYSGARPRCVARHYTYVLQNSDGKSPPRIPSAASTIPLSAPSTPARRPAPRPNAAVPIPPRSTPRAPSPARRHHPCARIGPRHRRPSSAARNSLRRPVILNLPAAADKDMDTYSRYWSE